MDLLVLFSESMFVVAALCYLYVLVRLLREQTSLRAVWIRTKSISELKRVTGVKEPVTRRLLRYGNVALVLAIGCFLLVSIARGLSK